MEIFLKLIDPANVFLNNMSIGVPMRLGFGPEQLLARNPCLIYAHASGWSSGILLSHQEFLRRL
jgi:crotonobetainyl-CoA:carnitine CoA-transferase CaiB-like acyl-CoA transferase